MPIYIANPVNFDGTNDHLSLTGNITGIADGKIALISCWFRDTGGTSAIKRIFTIYQNVNTRFALLLRETTNNLECVARNASNANVFFAAGPVISDNNWHHVVVSVDVNSAATRAFYVDGADATPTWTTYNNDTMDLSIATTPRTFIGASPTPSEQYVGDLADVYFTTPGTWFDITNSTNLEKFIAFGAPVDLGSDGSLPTGTAPLVLLSGATDTWHTNDGTGGGFTEVGAITDGAVALPIPPPFYTQTKFQVFNHDGAGLGPPP